MARRAGFIFMYNLFNDHSIEAEQISMKTIIIGLGNPILGDDGIGWRIAQEIERTFNSVEYPGQVPDFEYLSLGGLGLMEHLIGYDRAIVIDAVNLGRDKTGEIAVMMLEELPEAAIGHTASAHDTSLMTAVKVGRQYGAQLPNLIYIIGVETQQGYEFTEKLSQAVSDSIPKAVQIIRSLLDS